MLQDMGTIYEYRKRVTRDQQGSTHTLPILIEYVWSMSRVWLEYGYSMARDCNATLRPLVRECLEYAYTHRTGGQTPCAEVCLETKNLFPYGEQNIPTLGIKHSQPGNKTGFLRPFSSKRAELERRLASDEITARFERHYGSSFTAIRLVMSLLLLLVLGSSNVWGQTDYSGTYYIASYAKVPDSKPAQYVYDPTNPTNPDNYYLCPSDGWIYYKKENKWTADKASSDGPFLTTFKCRTDEYNGGMNNAKWVISKHGDYYAFYHTGTNKHMVLSGQISGCGADRMRVHLEEISSPENPSDEALFTIAPQDHSLSIAPCTIPADRLTVNGGNKDALTGQSGKTGGPKGTGYNYENTAGIVGIYRGTGTDDNRYFYLEEVLDRPTFTSTSSQIVIGHSEGNNATIYYTIDGTNPTTTNCAGSGAAPLQIGMPDNNVTLKAIAVIDDLPSCISSIRVVPNPTITLANTSLTYNGSAQTIDVTSVKDGDTTIPSSEYEVGYSNNINAGNEAVVSITNEEGGDYIVYGSTTFTINKKDLAVTAKPKAITYGNPPANDGVTYSGFVGEEDESVLEGTLAYTYNYAQYDNAGDYTITPSGLTGANYDISFIAGMLTVTPKEVGLTWGETTTFVYDAKSHAPTATVTGLLNGDEVGVNVIGQEANVGDNYTATASGLTGAKAGSYTLNDTYTKPFSITPATLTVTAKNHTISYGDAPANNGVSYDGFAGKDNAAVLGGTLTYAYDYSQYGELGNYTITPSGLTGDNYNISFIAGTLTVKKKTIGLKWTNTLFTYDREAHLPEATAVGTVNGEVITITVTGAQTNAGTHTATASALTGEQVGHYELPTANTRLFTIAPKSLGDGDFPAEGITISLTSEGELEYVKDGDNILTEDDFTCDIHLEGSDQIVAVTGKGNYTGSLRGIYASPQFDDPDGDGGGQAAAVYMAKRDLSCPLGISPYIIRKVNPTIGTAVITKLDYIPEDVPVLLLSDDEASGFVASPKDPSTPEVTAQTKNSNLLKVSSGGETVGAAQIYMFYKGEFVLTKAGTLDEGKFFLYNPNYNAQAQTAGSNSEPAPSRGSLQIVFDDETTGISELNNSKIEEKETDVWYTLDGRRLSVKPSKAGIYIHQGQKEYIKR